MFHSIKQKAHVRRGDLLQLFRSSKRFWKYLSCIAIGVPIWYGIGILVTFSPEFGVAFGLTEKVSAGKAVMYAYIGLVLGDLACGLWSQMLKSRRKAVLTFLIFTALSVAGFLFAKPTDVQSLYLMCLPLGFAVGYWSVFVTTAAEQFGTNLRSTVTTTVPNFVRGAVVPMTSLFQMLKPSQGIVGSALIVGLLAMGLAFWALYLLNETFGKDLDYAEDG